MQDNSISATLCEDPLLTLVTPEPSGEKKQVKPEASESPRLISLDIHRTESLWV
ncbi:hypothetical protein P7K49_032303 [Saguinus oedipus]|uniref:Uncharacterized protein n=1 Tax=Saguinus oedipus TaxID=9490 RepID=A0ABQ9TXV7_SAGOE|nr:hypothetical protein P7K49_032303 [Saguinus oedipus]